MDVGIRELRNHLSRYVDQVQEGQEIVITDRGKPVARMVPVQGARAKLERLIADGLATPAKHDREHRAVPEPIRARGTLSDLVIEGRGPQD
jgi:prevent-host-death family protein